MDSILDDTLTIIYNHSKSKKIKQQILNILKPYFYSIIVILIIIVLTNISIFTIIVSNKLITRLN